MRGLKGHVAVVTGGLGGIGEATVRRFIEEGCNVTIIDVDEPNETVRVEFGERALFLAADISDEAAVEQAAKSSKNHFGHAKFLVNNAAVFLFGSIDAPREHYERTFAVNIIGTALMTKHFAPQMAELGGGSIINLSSISGFIGQPAYAPYNASKFAIRGLTKVWAIDLAKHNIRVNAICPGYIRTPAFENMCHKFGLNIEEEANRAASHHVLGRMGRPEEVGSAIAFLASDDASFMTGSDLVVDGGYLTL